MKSPVKYRLICTAAYIRPSCDIHAGWVGIEPTLACPGRQCATRLGRSPPLNRLCGLRTYAQGITHFFLVLAISTVSEPPSFLITCNLPVEDSEKCCTYTSSYWAKENPCIVEHRMSTSHSPHTTLDATRYAGTLRASEGGMWPYT